MSPSSRRKTACIRSRPFSSRLSWIEAVRIVVALGGNALLKRGQPMTAEAQRANVQIAAAALAEIYPGNELVITPGNGPQAGLRASRGAAHKPDGHYPPSAPRP